jgi:hypothetical protein
VGSIVGLANYKVAHMLTQPGEDARLISSNASDWVGETWIGRGFHCISVPRLGVHWCRIPAQFRLPWHLFLILWGAIARFRLCCRYFARPAADRRSNSGAELGTHRIFGFLTIPIRQLPQMQRCDPRIRMAEHDEAGRRHSLGDHECREDPVDNMEFCPRQSIGRYPALIP